MPATPLTATTALSSQQVVAHRGLQQHYPENTLLGIENAIKAGAKFIECDVQLCKNLSPILYHDDNLLRVSDAEISLFDLNSDQLQQYNAAEKKRFGDKFLNTPIATLKQLTAIITKNSEVIFFIEIKQESIQYFGAKTCLTQTYKILEPVIQQCIVISFDSELVTRAKSFGFIKSGIVTRDWDNRNSIIKHCSADYVFINLKRLPETGDIKANCPIICYETTDIATANTAIARGISYIESFDIQHLLQTSTT